MNRSSCYARVRAAGPNLYPTSFYGSSVPIAAVFGFMREGERQYTRSLYPYISSLTRAGHLSCCERSISFESEN